LPHRGQSLARADFPRGTRRMHLVNDLSVNRNAASEIKLESHPDVLIN
jgi:hypothetical protein